MKMDDNKDIIDMYIRKSEGDDFLLSILIDLQSRDIKDTLTDNFKGFVKTI